MPGTALILDTPMTTDMELAHVNEILSPFAEQGRSVKQIFGAIGDIDELTDRFTFYMPVVHHFIGDRSRTRIATDIISHTLAQILREHPLVISDLPRPVFRFEDSLLIEPDLKSFDRTLYAVPTSAWTELTEHLRMLTVFDLMAGRFCVLAPHLQEISNPIGSHAELSLPVHYFNCYGNQETYYFSRMPGEKTPLLRYHPPIREFQVLADQVLRSLTDRSVNREIAVGYAAETIDPAAEQLRILAIQKENELHRKISIPLSESSLHDEHIRLCHDIIRHHRSVFGIISNEPSRE